MNKNQKGFGAVEIVIVIVVLALVGFGGWTVLHRHKATPAKTTAATKAEDTGASTNAAVNGDTTFLTIKEWGVKFALTADTSDAYYDTKTSSSIDSMSLRVHSLDSNSDCKTSPLSIAGIFRVPKDAIDDQTSKKYSETQDGQTIGDYFYFISGAQYNCTSDANLAVTLQAVRNSFDTAGPTIQKL